MKKRHVGKDRRLKRKERKDEREEKVSRHEGGNRK